MTRGIICAALFLLTPWQAAWANTLLEPNSGIEFPAHPTVNGTSFTCLGTGLRRILFLKVYAIAFCLESTDAPDTLEPYTGGPTPPSADSLKSNPHFFEALAYAPGGKMVTLHMLKDMPVDRLASAFRDSLSGALPQHKLENLIATIPGDAERGQTLRISSDSEGTLTIALGDHARVLRDAEIANKVWNVWLGPRSLTPSLKANIAEKLGNNDADS